ncbi:restriction endonuclease subunit S [Clostridium neuense]|uniref:Restriction endonuclease subunit S n=1 Tax=Clostridium neuense TaxID=1728934 RepID=A0ABW8TKY8_9CLOT
MNKTPKLRFNEFNGDWKPKKLGELLEFKNGINASKEQYGFGIKFINVLDVLNNDYITYDNIIGKVDIDEETLEKNSVEYGDVLFQRSSETREEVGTANVYLDKEKKATFGGFIIRGKKNGEYNPVFINKLLKTSKARKEITSRTGGSTRYNVGQEILKEVELLFPSDDEQKKIGKFLYLVDIKVQKQNEKIQIMQNYKKGIMQKIFKQKIKFKDENGREYPNWQEKRLREVLKERKTYSTKGLEYPHVTLSKDGIYDKGERYERDFLVKTENKSYKVTLLGDICYNPANLKFGVICINNYGDAIFSPIYVTFEVNKNFDNNYIGYFLMRRDFIDRVRRYEEGTVYERMSVKPEDFLKYKTKFPCLCEQEKIAKLFIKIDEKIEKENDKLVLLNTLRKGLLQQMFI